MKNNFYDYYRCLNDYVFKKYGFESAYAHQKKWPSEILCSSREVVTGFIQGLFDTDGSVQRIKVNNNSYGCMIRFFSTSKTLVSQLQYILLHYGIVSQIYQTDSDERKRTLYILAVTGSNVKHFYDHIGFRLKRKQKILENVIINKKLWKDNTDYIPDIKDIILDIISDYGIPNCVNSKHWNSTIFKRVKQISKTRVSQFLEYYGHINDARILTIAKLSRKDYYYDRIVSIDDGKCIAYDTFIPDSNEYCANGFYSHNSIPEDVFDIVVRGFTATTKTPVDEAKRLAFEKTVATLDIPDDIKLALKKEAVDGNQIIHSGTAYYEFNHFAQKHRMWCDLIESKGHGAKVAEIFGGQNLIPDNFDYRDYVVIQIPHTHLPEGLLDPKQLAHAKALLPRNIFLMEYGCVFIKDSDGFYCRSLIESCTVMPNNPIATPDGPVTFTPLMRGVKNRTYVIGIDPAAERDKFAIVVLEVWENHYRVVHCWSVNKPEFNKRKKQGLVTDDDYYAYCCSKIRNMVKLFNPIRIEMDSQGGGYPISEMLRNKKLLDVEEKDFPIYEVIDQDDPKETDGETDGRHILNLVKQDNTSNAEANVALHKSLETKRLLFPAFDAVKMESSILAEKAMNVIFDTFEECVTNIEELKNELCTIQMSATATGKERFDTPSVVSAGAVEGRQRKGRLKKDRFTALMLSHKFLYDTDTRPTELIDYEDVAGNFKQVKTKPDEGMYRGPGAASMHNAKDWQGEAGQFGAVKKGERH
ncbi:hypothetical protein LCGC14_1216470 [marine sediment metagenome]|uniref:DOD-type homing endonuclease domain-containing protein n=1 Tax=marine sediment metagenome TaxID=412755 RepID=A0A0F9LGL7_9ZZZZ